MDKKHSYDPNSGFLWSWDGDFHLKGTTKEPPDGTLDFFGENREFYEAAGALFLSGYRQDCAVIWCENDQLDVTVWFGRLIENTIVKARGCSIEIDTDPWDKVMRLVSGVKGQMPVVFCGKGASNPTTVAKLCEVFPSSQLYVCPVVDELAAFGNLVLYVPEKPRRATMWFPNKEVLDTPSLEFDPKLEGDGLGKMAALVARKKAVYNDIRRGAGIPTFYGLVLHDGKCGDT